MKSIIALIISTNLSMASNNTEQSLDRLFKKYSIKKKSIGLVVLDKKGESVYQINENRFKIPASLTKIPVAGAILENFSPNHTFKTRLYINKKPVKNKLQGNLYIKGDGDPSFTSERLWYLVNEFKRQGITHINGNIVVDDFIFDDNWIDPGRSTPRVNRAYDSPAFGLSFNWNSLNVFVKPSQIGKPAIVSVDPENNNFKNKTLTSKNTSRVATDLSDNFLTISGRVQSSDKEKLYYTPVKDNLWAGKALKSFLSRRGISVDGKVIRSKVPKNAVEVASSPSATVGDIVKMMMKFSNNFIAEMMAKHLSIKARALRGNIAGGIKVINLHVSKINKDLNVSPNDFVIHSVSGLSHKNRFKPLSLAKLLFAYKKLQYNYEFMASLPIGGLDGTLKNRNLSQAVRAKTGQLNNVYGIAGYINDSEKVFVIIYNGKKNVLSFMDELIGLL